VNFLKKISKEELLIGGAVFVIVYYFLTRKKQEPKKEDSKEASRLVIDDSSIKRRDFPADIEEQFKKVAGSSYQPFLNDLEAIGLDKTIALRQIYAESTFNPKATSPKGAKGLTQFIPSTWSSYSNGDPYNVSDSLKAYPKLMKDLIAKYPGRIDLALASYNSGPYYQYPKKSGNYLYPQALREKTPFMELKSKLPSETYKYVISILRP
jgi:soluble lytic murein transglycosylase-like protein